MPPLHAFQTHLKLGLMRILGIDPGLATIGLGVVETAGQKVTAVDWLTITTPAGLSFSERLLEISRDLREYIQSTSPEMVVVEKLYFSVNEKTALDVAHARGVILQTVASCGLEVLEASPMQLKLGITGDGKADKRQIQDMLVRMLELKEIPHPDDAADALALAVFGALQHKTAGVL